MRNPKKHVARLPESCVPPVEVKADGQDQKVTGQPYYDSISIKIVDDHSIAETDKKDGTKLLELPKVLPIRRRSPALVQLENLSDAMAK